MSETPGEGSNITQSPQSTPQHPTPTKKTHTKKALGAVGAATTNTHITFSAVGDAQNKVSKPYTPDDTMCLGTVSAATQQNVGAAPTDVEYVARGTLEI